MKRLLLALGLLALAAPVLAQQPYLPAEAPSPDEAARQAIVGDALLNEGAYHALYELSDRFGARMVGTPGHAASMDWLEAELRALGLEVRREPFTFAGWKRGEESVVVTAPFERGLRAVGMGYSSPSEPFEAGLAYFDRDAGPGEMERYRGTVLLLSPSDRLGGAEQDALVERFGVRGFLLTNRVDGGQLLARTGSFLGTPTPVPFFAITQEEGNRLRRLLETGETVRVRLASTSENMPMTGENLVATLPGILPEGERQRVVVGGHFDTWDLGQGALDNGLGVAQMLEAARLLKRHSPELPHSVEFVWFDAEEIGLWGSRAYAERHASQSADTDLRVMLNLDMVGVPGGLNAHGFDALVPILEEAGSEEALGSWHFTRSVANATWLGSDHHPFVARGIPSITFHAPIDPDASRFYHDFADTVDKVDRYELARASAIVALVTRRFAEDTSPTLRRLTPRETEQLLTDSGVADRLRGMGWWPLSPIVR
jgi:Iap family predicted aminopeptidase